MWGSRTSGIVRFRDFDDAKAYVLNTAPIRGRAYPLIPWRRDRKQPDVFSVRLTNDFNGMEVVACRMHATDILMWRSDGLLRVDPYNSVTTRERLNESMPPGMHIYTKNGKQVFLLGNRLEAKTVVVPDTDMQMNFTSAINKHGVRVWDAAPDEIGYLYGPGRSWPTKRIAAFMRTLHKQLAIAAKLSRDPAVGFIDGHYHSSWDSHATALVERHKELLDIMGDWKPGEPVNPELYDRLLVQGFYYPAKNWRHRLEKWDLLRIEEKGVGSSSYKNYTVVSYNQHQELQAQLQEIRK